MEISDSRRNFCSIKFRPNNTRTTSHEQLKSRASSRIRNFYHKISMILPPFFGKISLSLKMEKQLKIEKIMLKNFAFRYAPGSSLQNIPRHRWRNPKQNIVCREFGRSSEVPRNKINKPLNAINSKPSQFLQILLLNHLPPGRDGTDFLRAHFSPPLCVLPKTYKKTRS